MAKGLKIPVKKVKEVKKRLLAKTLTEDDCKIIMEMMDELGLTVPPKDD